MSDKPAHSPLPWEILTNATSAAAPGGAAHIHIRDAAANTVITGWYAYEGIADMHLIVEAVNAYHALLARNAELEDLIARMAHDESGLVEAGRQSERAAILEEWREWISASTDDLSRFAHVTVERIEQILGNFTQCLKSRGPAVLLPPDVTSRRLAIYEEALGYIANEKPVPLSVLKMEEVTAKAREALEKAKEIR